MKSPIETRLRNAICDQAARVESHQLMVFDHSTSAKTSVGVIEKGRLVGVADHEDWGISDSFYRYGDGPNCWSLYRDVSIDRYRADFLVVVDYGDICVAIECDGHEWHERTKQQASADRARDRALLRLNVNTLRFTGSDIFHDADACAVEVIETIKLLTERSFYAGHMHGASDGVRFAEERFAKERLVDQQLADFRGVYAGSLETLG